MNGPPYDDSRDGPHLVALIAFGVAASEARRTGLAHAVDRGPVSWATRAARTAPDPGWVRVGVVPYPVPPGTDPELRDQFYDPAARPPGPGDATDLETQPMGAMKRAQLARTMDAPADLGGAFALRPEVVNCTAYTHTPGYSDWIGAVGPKGPVCPQDAISAVGAKSSVPDPEDAPGATRDALTGESAGPSPPAGPERAACTWEAPARRSRGKAKRAAKGQTFLFGDQDDAERGS